MLHIASLFEPHVRWHRTSCWQSSHLLSSTYALGGVVTVILWFWFWCRAFCYIVSYYMLTGMFLRCLSQRDVPGHHPSQHSLPQQCMLLATGDISHQKKHSRKRNHQSFRQVEDMALLECDDRRNLHAIRYKLCNSFTSLVATSLASASCSDTSGSKCFKSWAAKTLLFANLLTLGNLKSMIFTWCYFLMQYPK